MSKYKVKRYDGEDESMVESDAMEEANKGENLDTKAGPRSMPRRPISRTPVANAAPRKTAIDDRSKRPSLAGTTRTYENYGNEGRGSKAPIVGIRSSKADMERAVDAITGGAGGATGMGIKGIAAAAQNLARSGAKEAPPMISAARGALDRAMQAERAAPKTGDMAKFSEALKAAKNAPRPVSKPTPSQAAFAKGPKGSLGRQSAAERDAILRGDTMDEFGSAMKRGGSVKKMASGGFTRSADGIAQRGKTRAQQFCGGGMSKGKR
jgi:hypothetical protein